VFIVINDFNYFYSTPIIIPTLIINGI